MPILHISTNVARADIPDGFVKRATEVMTKQTRKPEAFQFIHVLPDQMMIRGGSSDPCAVCYFVCVGKISEQENLSHTQALMKVINEDLKISMERMLIIFMDIAHCDCGWNGTNTQNF